MEPSGPLQACNGTAVPLQYKPAALATKNAICYIEGISFLHMSPICFPEHHLVDFYDGYSAGNWIF
jgi:hypothetical protein